MDEDHNHGSGHAERSGLVESQRRYLEQILTACVYDVAQQTPLEPAPILSAHLDNQLLLKREDLQPVFSFKLRGAYNRIIRLPEASRERGVICASAGNHAQGVALSARRLGIEATIVMPRTTPQIKIDAVRRFGGNVVLHGDGYDAAASKAQELIETYGLTYIPPYDHPDVIAGQGTVGMEILHQHPRDIHAIFIPVGGGGLAAGIAVYISQLRPDIRIIGVEPEDTPTLASSLAEGRRARLDQVGLFADGVAVRQIGEHTYPILARHIDDVVLVSTDEICASIKEIFEETRSILEPAGALAAAGAKQYAAAHGIRGETLVAINSGANMNFSRLAHVAERAELGEQREAVLAVTIPERPGAFREFCETIGERSITEFNYRMADPDTAHVYAGIALQYGDDERQGLIRQLRERGYSVLDLTRDEMAKVHIRHMVGGRGHGVESERIYRFEFPERPGALMQFLASLGGRWNISLFHYRNNGAAYGRVLCGIQVPPSEESAFEAFLRELHYQAAEETDNPAYKLFLS